MGTTPGVAPVSEAPRSRRTGLQKSLRVAGLVLFVLVGSFAARGRPANGVYYDGASDIIEALIVGAIIALFFLAIVGTVGYWISERRGRDRTRREVTFGRTAMIVTLVFLIISAAGRAAQHAESVSKAKPNPSGSPTERERAHRDAAAWDGRAAGFPKEERAWAASHHQLLAGLTKNGNTPAVRATAETARAHLTKALGIIQAIPDFPERDLNAERDKMKSILQLQIRGYDLYLTGLRRNARTGLSLDRDKTSLAILDEGDALVQKAVRLARRESAAIDALYKKYGIP
jgi:hypothetical protein